MPSTESERALPSATDPKKELQAVSVENPIAQAQLTVADSTALEWKPSGQEYFIIWSLSIISFMVGLDITVLVPALPSIAKALHGTAIEAFWVATSYVLSCTVCQPFITSLSHIFGRAKLLLASLLFFTIGTIVICSANGFPQLLGGRVIQGVGGGGIIALVQVIFTDIIPLRQRPKYFGYVQIASASGTISGPLVGGAISEYSTWRWIFYINFPFCVAGFVMILLALKLDMAKTSLASKLMEIDWFGGFLFTGSLTSFLVAISWGGVQFPWNSFQTIVPLILGLVGVGLALLWERYAAKHPFFILSVFNSRSAAAAQLCAFAQGFLLLSQIYYISFYFEAVKGMTPTITGAALLPYTVTNIPTAAVTGILITRLGRFRWAVWSGWIVTTVGTCLLIILDTQTSNAVWVTILIINGMGQGLLMSAIIVSIHAIAAGSKSTGSAAAMYTFTHFLGLCFGVALGGTVFQNLLATYLAEYNLPVQIAQDAESYIIELKTMAVTESFRENVVQAYAGGFRGVFIVLAVMGGVATGVSTLIGKFTMNRNINSAQMLRKDKKDEDVEV